MDDCIQLQYVNFYLLFKFYLFFLLGSPPITLPIVYLPETQILKINYNLYTYCHKNQCACGCQCPNAFSSPQNQMEEEIVGLKLTKHRKNTYYKFRSLQFKIWLFFSLIVHVSLTERIISVSMQTTYFGRKQNVQSYESFLRKNCPCFVFSTFHCATYTSMLTMLSNCVESGFQRYSTNS